MDYFSGARSLAVAPPVAARRKRGNALSKPPDANTHDEFFKLVLVQFVQSVIAWQHERRIANKG